MMDATGKNCTLPDVDTIDMEKIGEGKAEFGKEVKKLILKESYMDNR
jgi:hypothetical protein